MKILRISRDNFKNILSKAVSLIGAGRVVVCPTDTVYGLICDATNKRAVEKLFKVKQRQKDKPVPIFIKNIKAAKELAEINKKQEKFLKKFWPGKVTAVLKRKGKRKIFGIGQETIGLRVPNYKFINLLLERTDRPLVGTSANISGYSVTTKISEVFRQFKNKKHQPDLALDAGALKPSKPSKVVDLTSDVVKILRK